jgi:hypothetical protein
MPWVASADARVRFHVSACPDARSVLALADRLRRKTKPRQTMMCLRDIIDRECQTDESLALLVERGAHAIGSFAFSRRRHELERCVVERENRAGRAIAVRAPGRCAAEQCLIAGDTGFDVANQNDGVIKSGDHDGDKARMWSRT